MQSAADRCRVGAARRLAQRLDVRRRPAVRGGRVDPLERIRFDAHRQAGGGQQLAQLLGGVAGELRAAAADDPDVGDLGTGQLGQHGLRHVGPGEGGRVLGQDAGHVDGHVADPDTGDGVDAPQ
ncbi:hypothetical protein SDC9_161145 [bioreactor metagenome]|uniref:Uncharacterized protein n=1 Tax=bioreactor metagenome TaxID=1076179 RepID=A0A645FKF5_9ZZZZ